MTLSTFLVPCFVGYRLTLFTFRYIKELRLGKLSDEDWPVFCYQDGQCDPEDLEKGLFRGIYLLRVCAIFSFELTMTICRLSAVYSLGRSL